MNPLEALTAATRTLNEANAAYEDALEAARAAGCTAEQIDEATERGYE